MNVVFGDIVNKIIQFFLRDFNILTLINFCNMFHHKKKKHLPLVCDRIK